LKPPRGALRGGGSHLSGEWGHQPPSLRKSNSTEQIFPGMVCLRGFMVGVIVAWVGASRGDEGMRLPILWERGT